MKTTGYDIARKKAKRDLTDSLIAGILGYLVECVRSSRLGWAQESGPASRNVDMLPRFGLKVRERREALQLQQADLARQVGVTASYVSLIENDRRPAPSDEEIGRAHV